MKSESKMHRDEKENLNPPSAINSKHNDKIKDRAENKKLQVTFTDKSFEQMLEICNEIGIKPTEFVRQGCNLLAWAYDEISEGRKVGSFDLATSEHCEVLLPNEFYDRRNKRNPKK